MPAEYSEGDCGSSWHLVSSLGLSPSRSLCLRTTVSSVGMRDGRQSLSTHIRPRAPLIPIIHKFSQRDLYPPSALQCLLSLPPTSPWLLRRNEMSQYIRTQTCSHVWWWWQPSVSSAHLGISLFFFLTFYVHHLVSSFYWLLSYIKYYPLKATLLISFLSSYSVLPLSLYLHFLTIFSISRQEKK